MGDGRMSRFTTIDLAALPAMEILEVVDSEAILSARMQRLVELWTLSDPPAAAIYDVANLETDPIKINQEASTDHEMKLRDRINQAARGVTLAYAIGSDLDAIASRYPGGVPRQRDVNGLPTESDETYRHRIWLSVNPLSPHGTAEAYQFWALTALPAGTVRDVSTVKVRPSLLENPVITITVLSAGTDPRPTLEQLLDIRRYIQAEYREGMTDVISVGAPKVMETDYDIDLWFFPGPDANLLMSQIRTSVLNLISDQYWLGYDHTLGAIYRAVQLAGVARAKVLTPAEDILVAPDWVVRVNKVTLRLRGRTE
jgi:phage-related baseplate assembly protein